MINYRVKPATGMGVLTFRVVNDDDGSGVALCFDSYHAERIARALRLLDAMEQHYADTLADIECPEQFDPVRDGWVGKDGQP